MAHAKDERDQKDQFRAFRKAARELGCEPDEKRFQDALRMVAKAKPSLQHKQRRSDRGGKDHDA
jgi:hypothetical protein